MEHKALQVLQTIEKNGQIHVRRLMHELRLSQGSLYSRLGKLIKLGLIEETREGQQRQFSITKKGYQTLSEHFEAQTPDLARFLSTKEGKTLLEKFSREKEGLQQRMNVLEEKTTQLSSEADLYAKGYAIFFTSHFVQTLLLIESRLRTLLARGLDTSEFEDLLQKAKSIANRAEDRQQKTTTRSGSLEEARDIHEQVQPIIDQIVQQGMRKWGYHLTWTDLIGKWDDGSFKIASDKLRDEPTSHKKRR